MQEIGTVISSISGPNCQEFWFVVNENKGVPVRKGQFIQLETSDGLLIARVEEIIKTNRYYMRAESVSEFERSGRPLVEQFPVDRWEYLIAKATPLGIYSDDSHKRVTFPPSPGDKIQQIDKNILFDFLGLDKERGLSIGNVEYHDLESKLNITKLLQKHCAVLAQTGFGKSHLVSVLIEEILSRKDEQGKPAVIVIDPHGEYSAFSQDLRFDTVTRTFSNKNISIATSRLSERQICEFQPNISAVGRRELGKIIKQLREQKKLYDMNELIDAVESGQIKDNIKYPLISWLSDLNDIGIFKNVDSPTVEEIAKAGQLTVFDLSNLVNLRDRQIILTYFARRLFNARRSEKIAPFVFIVEEAHQFIPEQEERGSAISKNTIETIAREGRKFHACLILVSQRPVQLSTTALSQCNTNIILRVSNPYDLKHIGESCEGVTGDILNMLPGLKVGEALITGEAVNYPLLIKVRDRVSKKSEKEIKLEDALIKFRNQKTFREKDLETFM